MEALTGYNWPGNIRELQNFVERAVILSKGRVLNAPLSELKQPKPHGGSRPTLKDVEREHILKVLRETQWVLGGQDGAAARLGLPRTTLIYRMRRLEIPREPD
jgi:formate hydrogenlyase transcriptional activator